MTLSDVERDVFGEPLDAQERAVSGVAAATAAVGHAALGAAGLLLVYVVVTAV